MGGAVFLSDGVCEILLLGGVSFFLPGCVRRGGQFFSLLGYVRLYLLWGVHSAGGCMRLY